MEPIAAARNLRLALAPLTFSPPVTHTYNVLEYAFEPYTRYCRRWARRDGGQTLLLGMNPGPWGMAQTGIPFGEVGAVRDWLAIEAPIGKPAREHPKRPVEGLACTRSEVSGARLWGWARERFGAPDAFFERFWVVNYCPLIFLEDSGRNRTPDKIPAAERTPMIDACDEHLRRVVRYLKPRMVVGVGAFAEQRARLALADGFPGLEFGRILHPSPASPAANKDWGGKAEAELRGLGVL
ncbi:MAG: single-stranded DNA-binding protein [Sumerlaeia bacterium]